MRNFITAFEKRLQDLERSIQNTHRTGKVTDVKFDKEKKRWYVKMADGEGEDAFQTNWLPWKSFSHGTIKASIPPRKGQAVEMRSPGGSPELATIEPWHYNPDNPSPHDKEDEVFFQITAPEDQNKDQQSGQQAGPSSGQQSSQQSEEQKAEQQLKFKATKDGLTVWIGKSKVEMTKNGFVFTHDKNTITLNGDGIKHSVDDGKSTQTLTKDSVQANVNDTKLTVRDGESKFENGTVKHDDRNIGKGHVHSGVQPGGGKTQFPDP